MRKRPAPTHAAFLSTRFLFGVAFCTIATIIALFAFALYPGGNAFATQDEVSTPRRGDFKLLNPTLLGTTAADLEGSQGLSAPLPPSPEVPGATFVVNTTADTHDATPGDGICADANGNCSLRAAIDEANANANIDTITLPAGIYSTTIPGTNENVNLDGDYDITK